MKYLGVDNFPDNSLHSNTMILFEEHSVITDNKEIVDIGNNYFVDITKNLGPKRNFTYTSKSLESIIHIFRLNESFHRKNYLISRVLNNFISLKSLRQKQN